MEPRLLRIVAPHFVAGALVADGRVVETAPILGWAHGWNLRRYASRMGWAATYVVE